MKKMFCAGLLLGSLCSAPLSGGCQLPAGQSLRTQSTDYRIHGVSTAEDIGGVEVSCGAMLIQGNVRYPDRLHLDFENYNDCTVTVIFEFENGDRKRESGTIVLRAGEKRSTNNAYYLPHDFVLIVRKLQQ